VSPIDRRKRTSAGPSRSIKLLNDTPLATYTSTSSLQRSKLVKAIVEDIASEECSWTEQDRLQALTVVKELSRLIGSSETLGSLLPILVDLLRSRIVPSASSSSPEEGSTSHSHTQSGLFDETIDLLLRILNNVLLQHAATREAFASRPVGGMKLTLDLIQTNLSPVITFLSARLVFFCTVSESEVIREAVEELDLVNIFTKVRTNGNYLPSRFTPRQLTRDSFMAEFEHLSGRQHNPGGRLGIGRVAKGILQRRVVLS
jgi:hypothetical protein